MIPSDMITEILCRLPPKSIVRFRSVSKSFLSEVDDPEFVKLHYRCSLKRGSRQFLTFNNRGYFRLFDNLFTTPVKPARLENLTLPVVPVGGSAIMFSGSCRGLITLQKSEWIMVWNPHTRKCWIPPVPRVEYLGDSLEAILIGFGHDSLSDDYKLVRIDQYVRVRRDRWREVRIHHCAVGVYNFRSSSWSHMRYSPSPLQFWTGHQYGVLSHDALHFKALRRLSDHEFCFDVLAFNLHTEQFRNLVELPSYGRRVLKRSAEVMVLGGQLCAVFEFMSLDMEAWAIKDYGGKEESWTKLFRISLTGSPYPVTLLDYSESGGKILLHYAVSSKYAKTYGFLWIDLESRRVEEDQRGKEILPYRDAAVLVASMTSLG